MHRANHNDHPIFNQKIKKIKNKRTSRNVQRSLPHCLEYAAGTVLDKPCSYKPSHRLTLRKVHCTSSSWFEGVSMLENKDWIRTIHMIL
jgi:hypothetical protein